MRNQGHVTVFLSIILISMLLLGLSVLEMARIRMGSAKAAMAAEGAACDVKAAYDKELFEEYHLLAVDSTFGGHGEGKLEQMAQDYLEYTLENGQGDNMSVEDVALAECRGLLENDCENMKLQITDHMKVYMEEKGIEDILEMITSGDKAMEDASGAVENGKNESNQDESSWSGTDPRKALKSILTGGLLNVVTPSGRVVSDQAYDLDGFPSDGQAEDTRQWEDIEFDDLDKFQRQLMLDGERSQTGIVDDIYGVGYALANFNTFTDRKQDRPFECEVEYIIAGKDNDHDNLQGVVNRIVLHRLPLDGKSVQFMKTDEYWVTDINNLDKLMNLDSVDYEGVDAVSYRDYLAILLIENKGGMYYRMADLIQLNFRQTDESFEMKNMMYSLTFDVEVSQDRKFASFIEDHEGVSKIDDGLYRYSFRQCVSY